MAQKGGPHYRGQQLLDNLSVIADAMPPPLVGEALAGRVTFHWTPEARYGAKGRASLQRAGFPLYNLSVSADALPPPLVGEALAVPAK